MYLTNTLSRKKEKFEPINPPRVGMYTCGPTVYDFSTIGNFRTYIAADTLLRVLKYNGFEVTYIMNITDVGHLTGDNLGDADLGEDRMEKSAQAQGKSAWEIAKYYTEVFLKDFEKLNLTKPNVFSKATDHIKEQIDLVSGLEKVGFAYKISDGIYFDTVAFEKKTGKKYGELSTLDIIKEGARVEPNPEKKNPRDFAIWKFSPSAGSGLPKRQMEWDSPWGLGFPGWHLECSAMSMKYLGESFDIHCGGEDLRQTHHPNEIAQSEGVSGKTFVKYWVHATFLQVDGKRMGKSLGNVYTVSDIERKGFDPLALRYLYLTSYYRDTLNFTWESLTSSQNALNKLRSQLLALRESRKRTVLSREKEKKMEEFRAAFTTAVNDDLNTPRALAVMWDMFKSNIPAEDKYDLAISFDDVLGLSLGRISSFQFPISKEIKELVGERERLRKEGKFEEADKIRVKIEKTGYALEDQPEGTRIKKA
ncbi:cysteine--tRNA ligase [Candidatus Woesebacteria bacterium RIFCSPLOWO2_01_FULL_43_11]|uniref:Cysteine--tRNA ligase n=1 Tax=Candidatus Woesebacteria bacterium RBG_16_42_24 TaxID=1802485 RepID=A0A1F7XM44_9BACT|nr:MAG: cysteine--tRNA ligase [Candidatus Woesebacteria bacterium RBG_16_42_24]OGM67657.1 MAG: cysteine--tRNA ligase [Candidatus Woesebacteria bacterium RIFCSPLOWO2_01_FULL_43_11]